jgi:hypothetical protein
MSVPQQPAPISVDAAVWRLDANPPRIEESAQAWRAMGSAAVDRADALLDGTRTLLGSGWAGPACDSFAAHQLRLVAALDAAKVEGDKVAVTLERWASMLRRYQIALHEQLEAITAAVPSRGWHLPLLPESIMFLPDGPAQVSAVDAAVSLAGATRDELEAALASELLNFDDGEWVTLAAEWDEIVEAAVHPFIVPPEVSAGTSVLMVDGRAVVNTGAGRDDISVAVDPDTGEVIVTTNGTRHEFPPGTPITIRGGSGNDTIDIPKGTNVSVTLLGSGGSDVIQGGAGDDRILGGAGADEIFAGKGADYVSGGAGDDYVDGQAGGDVLSGGTGADVLYGLGGDDYLTGAGGDDYLEGAEDSDELQGGAGSDVLSGGRGGDTMNGGTGDDVMYGGQGRDSIAGGGGTDTAYGQDGDSVSRVSDDVRVEITGDHGFIEIDGTPEFQARILADLEMYRGSPTGQQMLEVLADSRDPNWGIGDITPDGAGTTPLVLYPELGHVYDEREDERRATGLPVDHDDDPRTPDILDPDHPYAYTENAMRDEMGYPRRDTYNRDGR